MTKRNRLGAALGTASKARAAKKVPKSATTKPKSTKKQPATKGPTPQPERTAPQMSALRSEDATFVGSTTTNGEVQDLDDPRVYHRKPRPGAEARSVRKMSVYMDSKLADRLDLARVRLRAKDRSELIERAVEELLQRLES